MTNRRARITRLIEQRREVVVRLGELRVELERFSVQLDRLALFPGVLGEHSEVVDRGRLCRIELERALEAIASAAGVRGFGEQTTEVDPRLGAVRAEPERAPVGRILTSSSSTCR